jgi:hypothetical protein
MKRKRLEPEYVPEEKSAVNDVELAHFEARLRIDKYKLDDELVEQPRNFEEVADRYALAKSLRDQAKDDLKTVEAERTIAIRAEKDGAGEKVTEKLLADLVQTDSLRKKAFRRFVQCEREANQLEGLRDAYHDRGWMIRELCGLATAGYFAESSVRGGAVNDRQNAEYERRKKEMNEKRKRRRDE